MKFQKSIVLKHTLIENKRCIGLHFRSIRAINLLMQELDFLKWHSELNMYYIVNDLDNIDNINMLIRTVAWINAKLFLIEEKIKKISKQNRGAA